MVEDLIMEGISQTVLIVDDDQYLLDGVLRHLRHGFDVRVAASAAAGLGVIEELKSVAVVVSDYKMPGMNGLDFLAKVYQLIPDTVRVMLTRYADLEMALAALNEARVHRFLEKPCPPSLLKTTLTDCLEHYRLVRTERLLADRLRATNASLERALQEADAANRAKSEFLTNMSHEIRTPMTAILGFADVLLEQAKAEHASPEMFASASTIRSNGQHLLKILNDILDLSKIEAGLMGLERIPVDLRQISEEVVSFMQMRAAEKGLLLTAEFEGVIPETVATDPTRVRQILLNLVSNAVKFTTQGQVRLTVTAIAEADHYRVNFDVADTGIGMSPEQAVRLFQPFMQADATTARRHGGTGLGLMLSRRLSQLLGGDTVLVATQPNVGTHFRAWIEAGVAALGPDNHAARGSAGSSESMAQNTPLRGCRILVAEDGPDNQRLIRHILHRAGAKVTFAGDGQCAVDLVMAADASGVPFDVVLMDMQMPVIDGYEATLLLRQRNHRGPIIALTAHAMVSDRERCIDAGCNDYACKPIGVNELIETIRRNVPGPGQVSPLVQTQDGVLVSEFAGDDDMAELIEEFVNRLPAYVQECERACAAQDLDALRRLAHQLRGSAGGYGFAVITQAAAELEERVKSRASLSELCSAVEAVKGLCHRAGLSRSSDPSEVRTASGAITERGL